MGPDFQTIHDKTTVEMLVKKHALRYYGYVWLHMVTGCYRDVTSNVTIIHLLIGKVPSPTI